MRNNRCTRQAFRKSRFIYLDNAPEQHQPENKESVEQQDERITERLDRLSALRDQYGKEAFDDAVQHLRGIQEEENID